RVPGVSLCRRREGGHAMSKLDHDALDGVLRSQDAAPRPTATARGRTAPWPPPAPLPASKPARVHTRFPLALPLQAAPEPEPDPAGWPEPGLAPPALLHASGAPAFQPAAAVAPWSARRTGVLLASTAMLAFVVMSILLWLARRQGVGGSAAPSASA